MTNRKQQNDTSGPSPGDQPEAPVSYDGRTDRQTEQTVSQSVSQSASQSVSQSVTACRETPRESRQGMFSTVGFLRRHSEGEAEQRKTEPKKKKRPLPQSPRVHKESRLSPHPRPRARPPRGCTNVCSLPPLWASSPRHRTARSAQSKGPNHGGRNKPCDPRAMRWIVSHREIHFGNFLNWSPLVSKVHSATSTVAEAPRHLPIDGRGGVPAHVNRQNLRQPNQSGRHREAGKRTRPPKHPKRAKGSTVSTHQLAVVPCLGSWSRSSTQGFGGSPGRQGRPKRARRQGAGRDAPHGPWIRTRLGGEAQKDLLSCHPKEKQHVDTLIDSKVSFLFLLSFTPFLQSSGRL